MAKVIRSGHGKGARSPLLTGITDEQARKLVGVFKPVKSSKVGEHAEAKSHGRSVRVRIKSKSGELENNYVLTSKKLKAG